MANGRLRRLRGLDERLTAQPGHLLVGVLRIPEDHGSPARVITRRLIIAMLVLFAGVRTVPADCLEAATMDGASAWQRFRHVLLPALRPVLFFVVVVETVGAFQVFDTVYVMTGGGPVRASYTLAYAVYDFGFQYFDFGRAAAAGVVLWAIVLLVSLGQRRAFDRKP